MTFVIDITVKSANKDIISARKKMIVILLCKIGCFFTGFEHQDNVDNTPETTD